MKNHLRHLCTLGVIASFWLGGSVPAFAAGNRSNQKAAYASEKPPHREKKRETDSGRPNSSARNYKLDDVVTERSKGNAVYRSRVIVTLVPGAELPPQFNAFVTGKKLTLINGVVLDNLPNGLLKQLAKHPAVLRVHDDREARGHNYRTGITTGARVVQYGPLLGMPDLGQTGLGVGIAIIDSGIATFHDDLTRGSNTQVYPYGNQRVAKFVDFVGTQTLPYDDNGHGSHVAGIIAGNGYDSRGEKSGIAPNASLVVLKTLDAQGQGKISNVIAALSWVATNAATYKIRVVNLSVGAPIRESYWTDPLTLACRALTNMGITVVVAAGNSGKNAAGHIQYGGINAPANAPWVLTVGASSTEGTLTRKDDTMASFSSRGPTYLDYNAKPDLVAPGVGTVSLAAPGSTFYSTKSAYLVGGSLISGTKAYLALSGTSMAAPVVTGTVALMLQANPTLTPNLIKAILQYTAEANPAYDTLSQGAGFLNTLGAVRLAKFYKTAKKGDHVPTQKVWSRQIIWGTHRLTGGIMVPGKNAWGNSVVWGSAKTLGSTGDSIMWGSVGLGDDILWGTAEGLDILWGTSLGTDILWGTTASADILWGTVVIGDDILWGSSAPVNVVWGGDCAGADCDATVWGVADADGVLWGTAEAGDSVLWGTSVATDILWGTSADADVTWGASATDDAALFPDEVIEPLPSLVDEFGEQPAPTVPPPADPVPPPAEIPPPTAYVAPLVNANSVSL